MFVDAVIKKSYALGMSKSQAVLERGGQVKMRLGFSIQAYTEHYILGHFPAKLGLTTPQRLWFLRDATITNQTILQKRKKAVVYAVESSGSMDPISRYIWIKKTKPIHTA